MSHSFVRVKVQVALSVGSFGFSQDAPRAAVQLTINYLKILIICTPY